MRKRYDVLVWWLLAVVPAGLLTLSSVAPLALRAAPQQMAPVTITYPAGWNLLGASPGTFLTGIVGPLYTIRPDGRSYSTVAPGTVVAEFVQGSKPKAGTGYWAYFASATPISIPFYPTMPQPGAGLGAIPFTFAAPIGQWLMIGNPYNSAVSVDGLPGVYAYVPGQGYVFTSRLVPGQGAFAYSETGASILLCPVLVTCG